MVKYTNKIMPADFSILYICTPSAHQPQNNNNLRSPSVLLSATLLYSFMPRTHPAKRSIRSSPRSWPPVCTRSAVLCRKICRTRRHPPPSKCRARLAPAVARPNRPDTRRAAHPDRLRTPDRRPSPPETGGSALPSSRLSIHCTPATRRRSNSISTAPAIVGPVRSNPSRSPTVRRPPPDRRDRCAGRPDGCCRRSAPSR